MASILAAMFSVAAISAITFSNSSTSIIIREVIASRKNLAGKPVLENSVLTHCLHKSFNARTDHARLVPSRYLYVFCAVRRLDTRMD